jgi:hypothetical protein
MRASVGAGWLLCVAACALLAPGAHAQEPAATSAEAEVALERAAPFDRWCVAPLCAGDPAQRPSRLKLPSAIAPSSSQGYLEQSVKREIARDLTAEIKGMLGASDNEAIEDVAEALLAIAASDAERLREAKGIGAAVARGALTYQLDAVVAADQACGGARRLDAIYEGLAMSVALSPLEFPKKKGHVAAACADTAKRTERAVDEAVLGALLGEALERDAATFVQHVQNARKECAAVETQAATDLLDAHATVEQARRAVRAAQEGGAPTSLEGPCARAIAVLRDADPARLDALAEGGLANVVLDDLAETTVAPPDPAMGRLVRLATGALAESDMHAFARSLAERLLVSAGASGRATPVLRDAADAFGRAVIVNDGVPTIDPDAVEEALASRFGEGPWLFEVNGGVPEVDFSQGKVVADLTFGYRTKTLGVVGRGWVDTYDFDASGVHDDYTHAGGSVEGWWLSGSAAEKLRFEVRLAGGFDYYDTTSYPFVNQLSAFYDFDSRVGRGSVLVGARYGTSVDRLSAQVLAGGGAQYEDPDTTQFTGSSLLAFDSEANLSAQASGRVQVHYRVVPAFLGVRASAQFLYFSITREDLSVAASNGALSSNVTVNRDAQLEVHGRLFFDADVLSVNGFVPALFGGLDYLSVQGTSSSVTNVSAAIPVLGIGIAKQSW